MNYLTWKQSIDIHFYKTLIALAIPIALQNLVASSLNMIDTMMIGQLGHMEIAAVGLANQIFFLFNLFLFGINSGAAIFTAQYWGKDDRCNIHRVQGISLASGLVISLLFTGLSYAIPELLLSFFTADPQVIALGSDYLKIVAISFIPTMVSFAYASVLRSTGQVILPLKINGIAILINTFLNYLLIYGNWGLPRLEVNGAAIATVIARLVEVAAILITVYRNNLVPAASWSQLTSISKPFVKKFFQTTIPVILNESLWAGGVTMYAAVYARMGTEIIAAINISATVERIAMVLFFGMAQACAVMVGHKIGAGDNETAFRYAKRFSILGPSIGILIAALLLISIPWILSFYQVDKGVLDLTAIIIFIYTLTIPVRIFNLILIVGILRSGGDTRFCLIIDTAGLWLIAVPLVFVSGLVWKLPAHWVYLMTASEECFKFILGIIRLCSKRWIHNLTHSPISSEQV